MQINIDTSIAAAGPFATDAEYLQFVIANAAISYQNQYGKATPDEGIAAAREAYNATVTVIEDVPA